MWHYCVKKEGEYRNQMQPAKVQVFGVYVVLTTSLIHFE